MIIKIFAISVSSVILILVIELVRREKLTFKYALGWMVISLIAIFFEIFDHLLFEISQLLGFTLPSNFIFFVLLTFFIFLSLFLTVFLCQQNSRNDIMAQKIGMLELRLKQLKDRIEGKE